MSKFCSPLVFIFLTNHLLAQEIFKKGDYLGLKYDGVEFYAPVFDEIKIHDYFVAGRIANTYYNLSRNRENANREYRRFSYKFLDRLLVIGYTSKGNTDILNETGEHFYLKDGPYDRVLNKNHLPKYNNDDMLTVRKKGKVGLYNWVLQKEILPTDYSKIVVHESCSYGQFFIYAEKFGRHTIWNEKGEELLSFAAAFVTDVFPNDNCSGFIIQWQHKVGFCTRRRDGSFFLLKPGYDDIYFPKSDASVIIVENREKFGMYVNNKRLLRCKYDEITCIEDSYAIAIAIRKGLRWKVMNNGDLILLGD